MSKQSFIYDSDDGGFKNNPFNVNKPVLVRAAGLTGCVPLFMAVGDCPNCRPQDVLWEQVFECGNPVEICPDDNILYIKIPGKYSLGDPLDPAYVIPGTDVNITKQEGVDPSLMGKCAEGATTSTVTLDAGSDCTDPIYVEVCNQNMVESSMAELGCIVDASNMIIGKVMLCKVISEVDGSETVTQTAYFEDGTIVQNYTGSWSVCVPEAVSCEPEIFIGVITDLTLLET